MYTEPDVKSSYTENNIGKTIYDIVYNKKPNRVLEFGALNGYSTVCIGQALRDVGYGTLVSYDLFEDYDQNSLKVIKLLKDSNLEFTSNTYKEKNMDYISQEIGEKVRKLPQVVINGKRIGGYYDLMEFLINKKLINYKGDLC